MSRFRVLVSYPPTREKPGRSRAAFIGELESGKDGIDAYVDAHAQLMKLLKGLNGGKEVSARSSATFDTVTLTNDVIIYLDTDPADQIETCLERTIAFKVKP